MAAWRPTRAGDSPPESDAEGDPLLGTTVGDRWRLVSILGEGGQARVYAGRDPSGGTVAVKVLHAHLMHDRVLSERFRREATHAASIAHRRIVRTLGVGELEDGRPWIAMERLEGTPLDALVAAGPLPLAVVLTVGSQIAEALARAHDLGLVHRDIKPANIFVAVGAEQAPEVKLVDFGLARRIEDEPGQRKLTRRGEVMGTPAYIAPELLRGGATTPSIDLYALGCVLFELLSGRPPFVGPTIPSILLAHLEETAVDVRSMRPETPRELAELVAALLQKSPHERPPDAHQVQRALDQMLAALDTRPSLAGVVGVSPTRAPDTPVDSVRQATRALTERVRAGDAHGRALADALEASLRELESEEASGTDLRARLRALEDQTYEARGRLGHAVHEVGVELSAARVAQRDAQSALDEALAEVAAAEVAFHSADRAMAMGWPARFARPSRALVDRVEGTLDALRAWCDARDRIDRTRAELEASAEPVKDLEYQLAALRERLADVEARATREQAEPGTLLAIVQARVAALDERLDQARAALEAHLARA